jgi:Rhodopirellula transposase DDE domain
VKESDALMQKFESIWPHLDERGRRITAAAEAIAIGRGGISAVQRACGLSRPTIANGIREIQEHRVLFPGRVRNTGAGRKPAEFHDPKIIEAMEWMIDSGTRGDPESPLKWVTKSTRTIAAELTKKKHPISHTKIAQFLHQQNYSLQGNRKTEEGADHEDRDAQFRHINTSVKKFLASDLPVISVDTKKKEILGNYKNSGQEWRPAKQPRPVQGHDFPGPDVPRAYPYGIYDIGKNTGFVNVGTDHDTSAFAVASIRGWWKHEGRKLYPKASALLITADSGGSNGARLWMWKLELQKLANETGITISVCHFPPGTSKWNKIEHRLFSFISSNWKGQPLQDHETVVQLIAHTTTAKGLKVVCRLDRRKYPIGRKASKEEMKSIHLELNEFHGEWNYKIIPC